MKTLVRPNHKAPVEPIDSGSRTSANDSSTEDKPRFSSVLSAIGKDEVGMVEKITGYLSERHHANIETIRATALGDVFAVLALFTADNEQMEAIHEQRDLLPYKVSLVEPSRLDQAHDRSKAVANFILRIYTFDNQMIVSKTTTVLKNENVDIIGIAGSAFSAPFDGSPMFFIQMQLMVPEDRLERLPHALEELRIEMNWADLTIEPVEDEPNDEMSQAGLGLGH